MSVETAADAFIRPVIARAATPAHAVAGNAPAAAAQQAVRLGDRGGLEQGAMAEHETAAAEFEFQDLLDIINPLQHLPGISTAYRAMTGDEIKAPARVLGGIVFGGPIGLIAGLVNAAVKESSGRDLGETALAAVFGGTAGLETGTVAAAAPAEAARLAPHVQPAAGGPAAETQGPVADAPAEATATPNPSVAPRTLPGASRSAESGPVLTGQAAINAFVSDLTRVGRGVQSGAPDGETAERVPSDGPAEADRPPVPANLVGLGGRDQRPGVRPAAVIVPAEHLTGGQGRPAKAAPTEPRLPRGPAPDPRSFIPGGPAPAPGAAPEPAVSAPEDFSAEMLRALQKYESMLKDRRSDAGEPG